MLPQRARGRTHLPSILVRWFSLSLSLSLSPSLSLPLSLSLSLSLPLSLSLSLAVCVYAWTSASTRSILTGQRCVVRWCSRGAYIMFFNTYMKKVHFQRRKLNRKSIILSVWWSLPRQREEKFLVSRYMTTRCTRSPIHFSCKIGPIPALIKKVLCVTIEHLTFLDSDNDFGHSWTTPARSLSSLERVNFPP